MANHPTPFELEERHAEGHPGVWDRHLESCAPCRASLGELDEQRRAFVRARPAAVFVSRIRERVEREESSARPGAGLFGWALLGSVAREESSARPGAGLFGWAQLGSVALMTLLFVLLRPAPAEWLQLPHSAEAPAHSKSRLEFVSKGTTRAALVLLRGGVQTLERGAVPLLPGDEIRLQFELDRPARIQAGILTSDGKWVEFFESDFDAGPHTPEATLRVDDEPSSGTLLLGTPEEVARARAGDRDARVETLQFE